MHVGLQIHHSNTLAVRRRFVPRSKIFKITPLQTFGKEIIPAVAEI
jgi:hypothetical protein